jgi:hypothetical protein
MLSFYCLDQSSLNIHLVETDISQSIEILQITVLS